MDNHREAEPDLRRNLGTLVILKLSEGSNPSEI